MFYHYTYLISNLTPLSGKRYYIGVHSGEIQPEYDNYYGSSRYLKADIKIQGQDNFEKIIIKCWATRIQANDHEIELHESYNVKANPLFYNRANATSSGFTIFDNPETILRIAKTNKLIWENKTQEEKDAHSLRTSEQWKNKSQEEKITIGQKISNTGLHNWESKTQEEKDAHAKKNKDIWENKTQEEKDAHSLRSKLQHLNRTDQEQEQINKKNSESVSQLRWFNNKKVNKRCVPGYEPKDFTQGRLPNRNRNAK